MASSSVQLDESWKKLLNEEFGSAYFASLKTFLIAEKNSGKTIFPPGKQIFAAFDATPFDKVKVVILGQDPYHGPGQANGLCFSVNRGVKPPPSLVNIFKELQADLNIPVPSHGDLSKWAQQGILLLNATLTVRAHEAGSHQNKGWEIFTDKTIQAISKHKTHVVFILWGRFAQSKRALIDESKHHVIASAHPSPLSAHNGFWGSKPFSKTNAYLISKGIAPVDFSF
jgi:uracil-DNA glycosylase